MIPKMLSTFVIPLRPMKEHSCAGLRAAAAERHAPLLEPETACKFPVSAWQQCRHHTGRCDHMESGRPADDVLV